MLRLYHKFFTSQTVRIQWTGTAAAADSGPLDRAVRDHVVWCHKRLSTASLIISARSVRSISRMSDVAEIS